MMAHLSRSRVACWLVPAMDRDLSIRRSLSSSGVRLWKAENAHPETAARR